MNTKIRTLIAAAGVVLTVATAGVGTAGAANSGFRLPPPATVTITGEHTTFGYLPGQSVPGIIVDVASNRNCPAGSPYVRVAVTIAGPQNKWVEQLYSSYGTYTAGDGSWSVRGVFDAMDANAFASTIGVYAQCSRTWTGPATLGYMGAYAVVGWL